MEKEQIMQRLNELRVPYDSKKPKWELSDLLEDAEAVAQRISAKAGYEAETQDHQVVDRTWQNYEYQRLWPDIPLAVEKAVVEAFGKDEDPCFGVLYQDEGEACPNIDTCDVSDWCKHQYDKLVKQVSEESPLEVKLSLGEPRRRRQYGRQASSSDRVQKLAEACRAEFLKTDRKVHVAQSKVYDTYHKNGVRIARLRVRDQTRVTLFCHDSVYYSLLALHLQQADHPAKRWVIECAELTGHREREYHYPQTHKVKILPWATPAKQAALIMGFIKEAHGL